MTAEQRRCPRCGAAFTWTTAAPRQKFCGNNCRAAYNRDPARFAAGPIPPIPRTRPAGGTAPPGGGTAPASGTITTGGTTPPGGTTAIRPCPHCGKPVTAITWIVPPAAASVTTP